MNLNPAVGQMQNRQKTNIHASFKRFQVTAQQFQIGE